MPGIACNESSHGPVHDGVDGSCRRARRRRSGPGPWMGYAVSGVRGAAPHVHVQVHPDSAPTVGTTR